MSQFHSIARSLVLIMGASLFVAFGIATAKNLKNPIHKKSERIAQACISIFFLALVVLATIVAEGLV